jgi:transformation/transcription domain-associated protein
MFVASFEKGASETDAIIGGPPNPEQDNEENVISVFVSRVIDPENPFKTSVRTSFPNLRLKVNLNLPFCCH